MMYFFLRTNEIPLPENENSTADSREAKSPTQHTTHVSYLLKENIHRESEDHHTEQTIANR